MQASRPDDAKHDARPLVVDDRERKRPQMAEPDEGRKAEVDSPMAEAAPARDLAEERDKPQQGQLGRIRPLGVATLDDRIEFGDGGRGQIVDRHHARRSVGVARLGRGLALDMPGRFYPGSVSRHDGIHSGGAVR